MNAWLAAAEAALKAGRTADAIENLVAAVEADPAQTAQVYRVLLTQLYRAGRYDEGVTWGAAAAARFPRDADIWNIRGVMLRQIKRLPEALEVLDHALKISNPSQDAAAINRGNVLMDLGELVRAEQVFAKLARKAPRNADYQRQIGRSLRKQGKVDAAMVRFRQAVALKKDHIDAWLDIVGMFNEFHRADEAQEALGKALAANPDHPRLLEAGVIVMRRAGQLRRAEAYLLDLMPRFENAGWLQYQLGGVISDYDRTRGNIHLRRAVELEPEKLDYLMALVESLERTRTGDEGANIEEAYALAKTAFRFGVQHFTPAHLKVAFEVFVRVCAFDELEQLGTLKTLGRAWAETTRHTALLKLLGHVRTPEDRLELVEQHRIWGRAAEALAQEQPIRRPEPHPPGEKIRLGFVSSDLRRHPVGYFALPLFEHLDPSRFEVFCYSYYQGRTDPIQTFITEKVAGFRWTPDISMHDAAQVIADDRLDMLIELGGSTHMNKLEVMAYRPAPRQASWLGYPHSAGLSTIDYLLVDPYILPTTPGLMIEKPLMLKNAWYTMASGIFGDVPAASPRPPVADNGFVTFGTANNPQKYGAQAIAVWSEIMRGCADSRFLFVRPEGGSKSFRDNILREFAKGGIAADRILFEPVRGAHLPHYNRMDISLDTFPQTGGTTTCESLWMGAPCVTLVGENIFERLAYSVLMNLDLGELCAWTTGEYVTIATQLAHDPARIADLRAGMRDRVKASPLGQSAQWAADFYDAIETTVRADA